MASALPVESPTDPLYAEYLQDEIPPPVTTKKKKLTKAEKLELKQKEEIEFKKLEMRVSFLFTETKFLIKHCYTICRIS